MDSFYAPQRENFQRALEQAFLGKRSMLDIGEGLRLNWDHASREKLQVAVGAKEELISRMADHLHSALEEVLAESAGSGNLAKLSNNDACQECPNCHERVWIAQGNPESLECESCRHSFDRDDDQVEHLRHTSRIAVLRLLIACSPSVVKNGPHQVHGTDLRTGQPCKIKVLFKLANSIHRSIGRNGPHDTVIEQGEEKLPVFMTVERVEFKTVNKVLPVKLVTKIASAIQRHLKDDLAGGIIPKKIRGTAAVEREWKMYLSIAYNLMMVLIDCDMVRIEKEGVRPEDQYALSENRLELGPAALELLNELTPEERDELFEMINEDSRLMMFCPPIDHELTDDLHPKPGGFLEKSLREMTGTISNHRTHQENEKPLLILSHTAIDAVNHLQRTEWTVDEWMLDVANMVFDKHAENILETPTSIQLEAELREAAEVEEGGDDSEAGLEDAQRANKRLNDTYDSLRSQLDFAGKLLEGDDTLGNRFWHAWQFDWRGRLYTVSSTLTPQGSDISKGLIRFADERPIGEEGLYWLKVHVGLLWWFGDWKRDAEILEKVCQSDTPPNKLTFEQRAALADLLLERGDLQDILSNVEKDIDRYSKHRSEHDEDADSDFLLANLTQAEKDEAIVQAFSPWTEHPDIEHRWIDGVKRLFGTKREDFQRLAAARELVRVSDESKEKPLDEVLSGLPIVQDASCNIFQHASALMRDADLAEKVNVKSADDGTIGDIYHTVANRVKELWKFENVDKELKVKMDHALREPFLKEEENLANRGVAKGPVMVTGYGSRSGHIAFMSHNRNADGITGYICDTPVVVKRSENKLYTCPECEHEVESNIHQRGFQQMRVHYITSHLPFEARICPTCDNDSDRRKPKGGGTCAGCDGRGYVQTALDTNARLERNEHKPKQKAFGSLIPHIVPILADGKVQCPEKRKAIRGYSRCKRFSKPFDPSVLKRHLKRKHPRKTFHPVSTLSGFKDSIDEQQHEAMAIQLMHDYLTALSDVAGGFEDFRNMLEDLVHDVQLPRNLTWTTASGSGTQITSDGFYELKPFKKKGKIKLIENSLKHKILSRPPIKDLKQVKVPPILTWTTASGTQIANRYYKQKKHNLKQDILWGMLKAKLQQKKAEMDGLAGEPINPRQESGKKVLRRVLFDTVEEGGRGLKIRKRAEDTRLPSVEPGWLQRYADDGDELAKACIEYMQMSTGVSLSLDKVTISTKSVKKGIGPNFIHSLDAAHMALVLKEMADRSEKDDRYRDFWAVHDAYGCHASVMGELRKIILDKFVEVHTVNPLARLVKAVNGKDLPGGELDIEHVRDAEYLVS